MPGPRVRCPRDTTELGRPTWFRGMRCRAASVGTPLMLLTRVPTLPRLPPGVPARGPGDPPVGAPAPAAGPARLEHRRARLPRRAPRVRHRSPARRRHPALTGDIALPGSWQAELRTALETPASAPADRESVRQRWADNDFRRYLGHRPHADPQPHHRPRRPALDASHEDVCGDLRLRELDVRVCVVGNGCEPQIVPPGALTVHQRNKHRSPAPPHRPPIELEQHRDHRRTQRRRRRSRPGTRPRRVAVLPRQRRSPPPAPTRPRPAHRPSPAAPRPAYVQPRLAGPDDLTTPRR